MAAISHDSARHRGRIAGLTRAVRNGERPIDDPELVAARRDFAAARIADRIEEILESAPPLTNQQRTALAELLGPARRPVGTAETAAMHVKAVRIIKDAGVETRGPVGGDHHGA